MVGRESEKLIYNLIMNRKYNFIANSEIEHKNFFVKNDYKVLQDKVKKRLVFLDERGNVTTQGYKPIGYLSNECNSNYY